MQESHDGNSLDLPPVKNLLWFSAHPHFNNQNPINCSSILD